MVFVSLPPVRIVPGTGSEEELVVVAHADADEVEQQPREEALGLPVVEHTRMLEPVVAAEELRRQLQVLAQELMLAMAISWMKLKPRPKLLPPW